MSVEGKPELHLEIAHVLFIDVVGFSKLLINDQTEILCPDAILIWGGFSLGLQLCLLMIVALQEVGSAQPARGGKAERPYLPPLIGAWCWRRRASHPQRTML